MIRIAILDDYQNTALACANWDSIPGDPEIAAFREHLPGEDAVAGALADFDVVVAPRFCPTPPSSTPGRSFWRSPSAFPPRTA